MQSVIRSSVKHRVSASSQRRRQNSEQGRYAKRPLFAVKNSDQQGLFVEEERNLILFV